MNRFILALVAAPIAVAAVPACSSTTTTPGAGSSGNTEEPDPSTEEDSGIPGGETQCTAARTTHLLPIAKVSTAQVKVLSTEGDVMTLYVDAAAGGAMDVKKNPRVYIKLTGEKVEIDDKEAFESSDWDLALKRVDIYTNSGDAGPGKGGAAIVRKSFDEVTAADAEASLEPEQFFDEDCNGLTDEASFIITTFSGWYDYEVGGGPTVRPRVSFIVRGADGTSRYKVGIVSYTGTSDGGTDGPATGRFILKVAPL